MPGSSSTVVRRRTRFGQDRLYVSLDDGRALGWTNLKTGRAHPCAPECLPVLAQAVEDWKAGTGGRAESAPPPAAVPAVRPVYGRVGWGPPPPGPDLLNNAPGAAARAQATALRNAAPARTFLARLIHQHSPERAWRLGAEGEELVAGQLAGLVRHDPRWRVLHAIPVGVRGADIDHLVIGPGGVYSLNAKHHARAAVWVGGDAFLVNGQRQPYVRNSRHEATRAARLLTAASGLQTYVGGVIVPVRVRSVKIKTAPADVAVVSWRQIAAWLAGRPPVLDDHTVSALFEAARSVSTWQPRSARRRG